MATSSRRFNVGLYREHLEEASFMYDQRLACLHNSEVNWPDLHAWEERLEAHIDALVLGGDLAVEICRQQAAEGDVGEMYAALLVLCRQDRKSDTFAILGALDPDEGAIRAAAQALCWGVPTTWREDVVRAFQSDRQHLTGVLARVIGCRRFGSEDLVRSRLAEESSVGRAEMAWALGRVGTAASVPVLWSLLERASGELREAAAIALMRLGDDRPLQRAMKDAPTERWARRVLAIGGDSRAVRVLIEVLDSGIADADAVLALGLLGDLAAVAPLLALLENEEVAVPAAVALNTITGAELAARVFVPDDVDPEELQGEEREAYDRDGTLPMRLGEPYGSWERRPLLDKAGWRSWLEENKHRFNRSFRWRMGKPHGPEALLECLKSATSPYAVRSATYDELVVRYGLDVPFEVDFTVSRQTRLLERLEAWSARQLGSSVGGGWYFGGRPQGNFGP